MEEFDTNISYSIDMNEMLKLHNFYLSKKFFNKEFKEVILPLMECFNESYGFPLHIKDSDADYYSSVTSTILMALYHMNLINYEFKNKIYKTIFQMKDFGPNRVKKSKNSEDIAAWDVSEGANCWTTSLVIESLLESGYSGEHIEEIKNAILWLKDQQKKEDGGWGFDCLCTSRIFFTARVVYALHIGLNLFKQNISERKDIERSIELGTSYIKDKMELGENVVYWPLEEEAHTPDPTNTVISLWILNKLNQLDDEIKLKGLNYLRKELSNKEIWDFRSILHENDTKYGQHKVIVSFTPSIPLVLLELGVKPLDELCVKPIYWLKKNFEDGWKLPNYREKNLSFIYAMGLWTVTRWQREVVDSVILTDLENSIFLGLRKRIKLLLTMILLILFWNTKDYLSSNIIFLVHDYYIKQGIINLSAALITIIGGIFALPKILIYLDQRFFNANLKSKIKDIQNFWNRILYMR